MKIMLFNEKDEWVEVENGLNFDIFYTNVVLEERPFKFEDCTDDEKACFLRCLKNESAGLDDGGYYHSSASNEDSVDNIFIFDDLQLYTLDKIISRYELILNKYKDFKRKTD